MSQPFARTDVFTRHTLSGFTPVVPHIRYPVTLGLYQEGSNLGLFIAPADMALIRRLTQLSDDDQALVLDGAKVLDDAFLQANPTLKLVSWSQVDQLTRDADVIHIPRDVPIDLTAMEIPTPVLAAPDQAVPKHLGSKVAIGFGDDCHAAVISPDSLLIRRCLDGFISAFAATAADRPCPPLPDRMLEGLLRPMSPGSWCELRIIPSQRFLALEFAPNGDSSRSTRWICSGSNHNWRTGWSW